MPQQPEVGGFRGKYGDDYFEYPADSAAIMPRFRRAKSNFAEPDAAPTVCA